MIKLVLKWVAPGLVTVLGGTGLAVLMTGANVAADIQTRATLTLLDSGDAWAELSVDARDVVLRGTTTDQLRLDAAIARLTALHGVGSVTSDVQLAPFASPYPFAASIDNGRIALRGGVPDAATRDRLLSDTGAEDHGLQIRSGMPKRSDWLAGITFAVDQLKHFDQGQVAAADLSLSLSGRARSPADYTDLLLALKNDVPAAVALGDVAIAPPVAAPYRWSATSDGKLIQLAGYIPDPGMAERLRTADTAGMPIATALALASGEPQGFSANAKLLLQNLALLEHGTATIVDGRQTLTGAAATPEIAQTVTRNLAQTGSIITLEPPRINDYWMSATRQPGGVIVFDGYAPDEATRKRLSQVEGADVSFLKLGRGAPQYYQSAVDFGLSLLGHLSEGRVALRANIVTLTGVTLSSTDYEALVKLMAAGAPQGLVLIKGEINAPPADPYLWSAIKSADGAIALSGAVPDPDAKTTLGLAAGAPAVAALTYASGEPADFLASAVTALDLLKWLDTGSAAYDGTAWAISGQAATAIDKGAIEADFATRKLAAAGWSLKATVAAPVAPAAPPAPAVVSPYTWSAARTADGAVTLAGHVPTEGMKKFLAIQAGAGTADTTAVGAGAPDGFVNQARAALGAVLALQSGKADFDGEAWTLEGQAASTEVRDAILAALGTTARDWVVNITAPEPKTKPAPVEPMAPTEPVAPDAPVTAEPPMPEPSVVEPPVVEPPMAEPPAAPPVEPPATPAVDPAYTFSASRTAGGALTMSGQLPAEPALRFFGVITGAPTAGVTVAAGAPAGFILSAETGIRSLMTLQTGNLAFAGGKWSLSGKAASNADRAAVTAAIAALPAGAEWAFDVTAPPPLDACQAKVAEFSAANSILFQSGAAIIAEESEPALDQLAGYLALCPEADVDVEGHTDADGDDQLNLALSVARAEAVVKALITRNVAASRLYAIGYGESQPIADNDTSAGKRLNRRIVVTVLEHHVD